MISNLGDQGIASPEAPKALQALQFLCISSIPILAGQPISVVPHGNFHHEEALHNRRIHQQGWASCGSCPTYVLRARELRSAASPVSFPVDIAGLAL